MQSTSEFKIGLPLRSSLISGNTDDSFNLKDLFAARVFIDVSKESDWYSNTVE